MFMYAEIVCTCESTSSSSSNDTDRTAAKTTTTETMEPALTVDDDFGGGSEL